MRRRLIVTLGSALLVSTTACHHRRAQPVLLPPQTPVPLVNVPAPNNAPLVEETKTKLPAVPVADQTAKLKKPKKRQKSTATAAAVTPPGTPALAAKPADATPADDTAQSKAAAQDAAIGALTAGGEQNPRTQQEATELIAANERRLNELSTDAAKTQSPLVSKARNFQRDAQQALKSGDAEGAKTLATKGKLLLDDLDHAGSSQ